MPIQTYTNNTKPPKRKGKIVIKAKKAGPDPKEKTSVKMEFERGKVKKEYKPASVETGHPAYGKPGEGTKVAAMLSKAREQKKDIVMDKEGKPYRAGYTTTTKEPDKFSTKIDVKPDIRPVKLSTNVVEPKGKTAKGGKLKPMGMTYGGETRKGTPTTKYKLKVRAR